MSDNATFRTAMLAGKDQFARTPASLLLLIRGIYFAGQPVFDPCPVNPKRDGLSTPWKARNYVNPPFKDIRMWAEKAVAQQRARGASTVLLVPTRTSTRYLSDIVLPVASSLVLWTNRIAFAPYKSPIPVPIMTVFFSPVRKALRAPTKDLKLHPVAFDFWKFPAKSAAQLAGPIKRKYGAVRHTYTVVTADSKKTIEATVLACRKDPSTLRLLLMMPAFNATYFQAAAPLVREVVFISPGLQFAGHSGGCFLGSVLVAFSAAPLPRVVRPLASGGRVPACYLAVLGDGGVIGPE